MMDSKRELPTGAVDLVIRFASSVSDLVLTIPHPESTSALSLKQLIRPHLPDSIASNRLRLISAGKVLVDNKAISDSITIPQRPPSNPAPDPKGKGKAAVRRLSQPNPRVYIHCSIGDALSASDLAAEASASSTPPPTSASIAPTPRPAPTPARPPRGCDRLLDSGFGPEDVAALRTQFLAIQAHTHTPDTMPTGDAVRALEDRWLDDDMGGGGVVKTVDGWEKRGFKRYVGGGLGAVPHQAQLFNEFVPVEELLPISQAIARVFARLGEKKNRNRARIKFLIAKLGIEEFRRLVHEERAILPEDPQWTAFLDDLTVTDEEQLKPGQPLNGAEISEGFAEWYRTNVYQQRQVGYVVATVALPLGDITSHQLRALADISRRFVKETARTTVEQNMVLRWGSETDLPQLYDELLALGLAQTGSGTIVDITACPGTDTCKLGIASSRGLATELRKQLGEQSAELDEAIEGLRIKISGCFNSCGQHHAADIGFYGNSRKINGITVPHFQVVLGGQWKENAGSFGLATGAVPSKNIPDVVSRLAKRFVEEREKDELFKDFIGSLGKREIKAMLEALTQVPSYEENSWYYRDWGDTRGFTMDDLGKGECAGEVVSIGIMEIAAAEREVFEASVALDENELQAAWQGSLNAMLRAARTLVKEQFYDVPEEADVVVAEFRARFYDTELFSPKFANYLFSAHQDPASEFDQTQVHRFVEEAQLFIEGAYTCYDKIAAPLEGAKA